ncbi:GDSL esterase/lipase At1g31550-like [Oryza brachyantha]|uniref:Esterase n=1 Tax=Oryza brachyantha TaxID=4533 RepID=J3LP10_ORYBR|nr:GDSL esterase/lipase At1g31550-like [Oryza brachyantha]
MAHYSSVSSAMIRSLILLACAWGAAVASHQPAASGGYCYTSMFSFGDSITDTGNQVSFFPTAPAASPPYGETFFGHPTGRYSDGRLVVDFLAEALRLPYLTAFLRGKTAEDFRRGANFAVSASTALGQEFFRARGLDLTIIPPFSLDVQLEWFKGVLHSLASTNHQQESKDIMARSLFLMGEIGINDYNHHFFQNRSFTAEIKPLVPMVIAKIANATKVLIDLGAKTMLVPGIPPMGCIPRFLNLFPSKNPNDYDKLGCLKWLNNFSQYHNHALNQMLHGIHRDTKVTLIYLDYYEAMLKIIRSPQHNGFTKKSALTACCGVGGPYNAGSLVCNGNATASNLCPDPSRYISWDGLHLTEAAYHVIARGVLDGTYSRPTIPSGCTY